MYVEVIYLDKDKKYLSRKLVYCAEDESAEFFRDAVRMMKEEKIECLICLRNHDHILITSVLL